MKNILTLIFVIIYTLGFAQIKPGGVSYVTPKKDTMFLEKSFVGTYLKELWDKGQFGDNKPVIIMVADLNAVRRRTK